MKLKRRDLNRLIESLLLEVGPGVGMDPTGATMPKGLSREEYKQLEDASKEIGTIVAEIFVGLSPAGVAVDVKDVTQATAIVIKSGGDEGKLQTLAAGIGFIPLMGDAIKGAFKAVFGSGKKLPAGLTEDMIRRMDPREIDDVIENNRELERLAREKLEASSKGVKSASKASGKSTYLDELPADEIQDKLNELPISVKEYMDVRLTKTSTMNNVSKSGNRIYNDTVPLQATAFEDMMKAYGNIPNKGKVNVGLKPLPAGSPAGSARLYNKVPGFKLAPGDQVIATESGHVGSDIIGIGLFNPTKEQAKKGAFQRFGLVVQDKEGVRKIVSNESAAEILSRYPGLVDEIVAKIIQ